MSYGKFCLIAPELASSVVKPVAEKLRKMHMKKAIKLEKI